MMRSIEKQSRLGRRAFVAAGSATAVGVALLDGGRIFVDPRGAWAQGLTTLNAGLARTLAQIARDLYPHDRLTEAFYMKAIEPYDAAAAKDPAVLKLLSDGAAAFDAAAKAKHGKPYAEVAAEADRLAIVQSQLGTALFAKLRGDLIVALYNQHEVWKKFGYEGASAELGGYIQRGFNDLDWL